MNRNSGQILLVVLLSTAVILTVVMSVVSRSITDVSVSTNEEEALRAFSAAETAVERSLIDPDFARLNGPSESGDVGLEDGSTDASYEVSVTGFPNSSRDFVYPFDLANGEVGTIWYVPHNADGTLDEGCGVEDCFTGNKIILCWGQDIGVDDPAIELATVYFDPVDLELKIVRAGFDPVASRIRNNNFDNEPVKRCNQPIGGESFTHQVTVDLPAGALKFSQVKMIYNNDKPHPFAVRSANPGINIPSQGRRVEASGSSGVSTRRVEVFALFPEAPSVFSQGLFSNKSIVKQ